MIERHRPERARHVLGMLQPHGVPGLVDHREPGVIALDRIVVQVPRIVEPGVAAFRRHGRVIGPGRARRVGLGVAQIAVRGGGFGDLGERDVRHRRIHLQDGADRGLLGRRKCLEIVRRLARAIRRTVERRSRRKAERKGTASPLQAAENSVNVRIAGRAVKRNCRHAQGLAMHRCGQREQTCSGPP